jgi:hypothetical protein
MNIKNYNLLRIFRRLTRKEDDLEIEKGELICK